MFSTLIFLTQSFTGVSDVIMGQVFSTEQELSQAKETIGSLLYDAMLEGGALPELRIVHPLLLTNHSQGTVSRDRLQEQLQQVHTVLTYPGKRKKK